MTAGTLEFSLAEDADVNGHIFRAFQHDSSVVPEFSELVEQCLVAWRLTADAFREVDRAGFDSTGLKARLSEIGVSLLPGTPADDTNVTRNPYITDVTELVALRLLNSEIPYLEMPYPRVLHKEALGLQHHGIDLVGYVHEDGVYVLALIEVMASVEASHPPSTVAAHCAQLLENTLKQTPPVRLIKDLAYLHDECSDGVSKDVLNAFIVSIHEGSLNDPQIAIAVLVRPAALLTSSDWDPFRDRIGDFETAAVKANVVFYAIECDSSFPDLLDRIKTRASAEADEDGNGS